MSTSSKSDYTSDHNKKYSRNTKYQNQRFCLRSYSIENYLERPDYLSYFRKKSMDVLDDSIGINFNSIFPDKNGQYFFSYIPQEQDFNPFYRLHMTNYCMDDDKNKDEVKTVNDEIEDDDNNKRKKMKNETILFYYLLFSFFQDKTDDFAIGATEFSRIFSENLLAFDENEDENLDVIKHKKNIAQNFRNYLKSALSKGLLKQIKKKYQISKINDEFIEKILGDNFQNFLNFLNFMSFYAPVGFLAKRIESYYSYTHANEIELANKIFRFKNTYYVRTLDDNIVVELLDAMHKGNYVEFGEYKPEPYITRKSKYPLKAVPLTIMVSSKTGKRYAVFYDVNADETEKLFIVRLDKITDLICTSESPFTSFGDYQKLREDFFKNKYTWGTRVSSKDSKANVKITFKISKNETHSLERLQRESRKGSVSRIDGTDYYVYKTSVEDSREMQSWLKSYIKRIVSIECSDDHYPDSLDKKFKSDFAKMCSYYNLDGINIPNQNYDSEKKQEYRYKDTEFIANKNFSKKYKDSGSINTLVDTDINSDVYDITIKYLMRDFLKANRFYSFRDIESALKKQLLNVFGCCNSKDDDSNYVDDLCREILFYLHKRSLFNPNIYIDKLWVKQKLDNKLDKLKKLPSFNKKIIDDIVSSNCYRNLINDINSKDENKRYITLVDFKSYFVDRDNIDKYKVLPHQVFNESDNINSEFEISRIKYNENIKFKIYDDVKILNDVKPLIHFSRYPIPFSYSEKSWLLAALNMEIAQLFFSDELIDTIRRKLINDGVEPLFDYKNDFTYYDQSLDSDFPKKVKEDNKSYRDNYHQILNICTKNASSDLFEKTRCLIAYNNNSPKPYLPICLEHDLYGNKTRVFSVNMKYLYSQSPLGVKDIKVAHLNMHKILSVTEDNTLEKAVDYFKKEGLEPRSEKETSIVYQNALKGLTDPYVVFVELKDDGRDAITRLLTEFSSYKERAIKKSYFESNDDKGEDNKFIVSIVYPKDDLLQIVIRMLSFGPTVRILNAENLLDVCCEKGQTFQDFIEENIDYITPMLDKKSRTLGRKISSHRDTIINQQNELRNEYISRLKDQVELMNSTKIGNI